jgi:hypothetical protein
MFNIISKLNDISDKLEDIYSRDDLSNKLDKIASEICAKYIFRIKKPRRGMGAARMKRKMYYKMHRMKMRTKMKLYRKVHHGNLKKRKSLIHFHRFGG